MQTFAQCICYTCYSGKRMHPILFDFQQVNQKFDTWRNMLQYHKEFKESGSTQHHSTLMVQPTIQIIHKTFIFPHLLVIFLFLRK